MLTQTTISNSTTAKQYVEQPKQIIFSPYQTCLVPLSNWSNPEIIVPRNFQLYSNDNASTEEKGKISKDDNEPFRSVPEQVKYLLFKDNNFINSLDSTDKREDQQVSIDNANNNEQPLSKKQRREFVEFPPEDEVEPPLQFVEQPDEFQVANYNLQPLQTIKINVQVPEESVMKAELWEVNGIEPLNKAFLTNDMQPIVSIGYTSN